MEKNRRGWPDNFKCASMVTINLNVETFWLQLDPDSVNRPKTLSLGQYGVTRGINRILDVLEERNILATVFIPGWVAEHYSNIVENIHNKGHEIGVTGYDNENMGLLDYEKQLESIQRSVNAIKQITGEHPIGFRTPQGELTTDTLRAAKDNGILYSSNLSNDDKPYDFNLGNNDTILEIPIHWAMYDLPYFAFNYHPAFPAGQGRIANYTGVLNNWIDEFDGFREYGLNYVLCIDPAIIGSPGRVPLLEELLDHMKSFDDVWFATGKEIFELYKTV